MTLLESYEESKFVVETEALNGAQGASLMEMIAIAGNNDLAKEVFPTYEHHEIIEPIWGYIRNTGIRREIDMSPLLTAIAFNIVDKKAMIVFLITIMDFELVNRRKANALDMATIFNKGFYTKATVEKMYVEIIENDYCDNSWIRP